ncbi:hypothetical protein FOIG_16581 [Fusarium odoratissimum NRRL 54006]|uniref:Malate dehydrogenase n=1 Tax=Fusarium odoratissimum (strain NRRL 54006) TaxID=1089451 RepID=X0J1M5_FUSO5|nr:uncharacterized protein FOIG_16581 [Fusarium odoratissimum NRRL 54006]EXL90155.1 hypothetical protein FOIG_16581 [Fusarium odoratissimum NRRL 54006]
MVVPTASELPEPSQGVALKHIALGFGIQNYTCADTDTTPKSVGALAVLYDVTHLYPGQSHSSLTQAEWASLPGEVLNTLKVPLDLNENGIGASPIRPFPKKQDLKKIDGIKAPDSSPSGPDGTGAVDWLFLGDAGGSHGISFVYRVLTASGASHECKTKGVDSTSYAAMYWFYN